MTIEMIENVCPNWTEVDSHWDLETQLLFFKNFYYSFGMQVNQSVSSLGYQL